MKRQDEQSVRTFIRLMKQIGETKLAVSAAHDIPGVSSRYQAGAAHAWLQAAEELRAFFQLDDETSLN